MSANTDIPGRTNLLVAAVQVAAALLIFWGLTRSPNAWQVVLFSLGFVVVGNAMYFLMHEAEHRVLHANRRVNDVVGTVLAGFFPAPFALLRRSHLAHHHYNRAEDEAFDLYLPEDPRAWKVIQFYGLLVGVFYLVTVVSGVVLSLAPRRLLECVVKHDRQTAAFVRLLTPDALRWVRWQTAFVVLLHAGLVLGFGVPLVSWLVVYAAFGFSWSTTQYLHHYGAPIDRYNGAFNLRPVPGLSWLWLNHHHHLTHHRHPRAPWTRLPELSRCEGLAAGPMMRQYLRQWRGPRLRPASREGEAG